MSTDSFFISMRNVRCRVQLITPALAKAWLDRNTKNRNKRQRVIGNYCHMMATGQWLLSDSAIMFDCDGNLINGQHRLEACIKSNHPFYNLVCENVPVECFLVMDQGERRKTDDLLKIAGVGDERTSLGAIVNAMAYKGEFNHRKMTTQECIDFVREHQDAISFVVDCFGGNKSRGGSTAPVRGVIGRAYYHADHDRLREFVRLILQEGAEMTAGNEAVYRLRDYLRKITNGTTKGGTHKRIEFAVESFLNYEPIKQLRQATEELYPLPSESETPDEEQTVEPAAAVKLGPLPNWTPAGNHGAQREQAQGRQVREFAGGLV